MTSQLYSVLMILTCWRVLGALGAQEGVCTSSKANNATLSFEDISIYSADVFLPDGYRLKLACCATGYNSVEWTLNGTSIADIYKGTFWLEENNQVLQSTVYPPSGVYSCMINNKTASISKTFNVTNVYWDTSCSLGTIGEILQDSPPTSVYEVPLHSPLQLTCSVLTYCGTDDLVSSVAWSKATLTSDDAVDSLLYFLNSGDTFDPITHDSVNVTSRYISNGNVLLVQSVLTIANVSMDDCYDHQINGCANDSCVGETCSRTSTDCGYNSSKLYAYHCNIILESSDNPAQQQYLKSKLVKLYHKLAPGKALPAPSVTESTDSQQTWIILGCLVGFVGALIMILTIVYIKYEWNIRVYAKRFHHQLCSCSAGRSIFKYNGYIACCPEDEPLVYQVITEQLERHRGYRLCLPERDFVIGSAIPEQISSYIKQSEYFIAVVSPRFWKTEWCSLALETALQTKTKIVVIHVTNSDYKQLREETNIAKALKSPGCQQVWFCKQRKKNDNLALKLECAMPMLSKKL